MAKEFKIHNNDDKTIFAVKVEESEKNKKVKASNVVLKIFIILFAFAASIGIGYLLHLVKAQ